MKLPILLVVFSLLGIFGCRQDTRDEKSEWTAGDATESSCGDSLSSSVRRSHGEIVNACGMKFVRLEIDTDLDVESDPPVPTETYHIQKDEISSVHLRSLRAFVKSRNVEPKRREVHLMSWPCEWRDFSNLAAIMSEYDPDYDYGLPSRSQWIFACMSGYEQRCDENRPNAYGIVDMLDGDVEVIDELGVLMGRWINNWGAHTGKPKPDCPCEHWTLCNPDADDSLNEIIVGRFILLPEGTVHTTDE